MSDSLAFLGVALTALLALIAAVYTARSSRAAADRASQVAEKTETVKGLETLVVQQGAQLEKLWPRLEQMERDGEEDRKRIGMLERRLEDYARRYRAAVRYVVQLRAFINEHVPGAAPPPPPEAFQTDWDEPLS